MEIFTPLKFTVITILTGLRMLIDAVLFFTFTLIYIGHTKFRVIMSAPFSLPAMLTSINYIISADFLLFSRGSSGRGRLRGLSNRSFLNLRTLGLWDI